MSVQTSVCTIFIMSRKVKQKANYCVIVILDFEKKTLLIIAYNIICFTYKRNNNKGIHVYIIDKRVKRL